MPATRSDNPSQEGDNNLAGLRAFGQNLAALLRGLTVKSAVLLALWALFMVWTGLGIFGDGAEALYPTHPANPYAAILNQAAPLFALNLWGFAAGLVFGLAVANPFAWLNGKRLVFACMAFAMILGRLVTGYAAGPLAWLQTVNQFLAFVAVPLLLLFGGGAVIIAIGTFVGAVFSFFVGIPVLLFNQIFAFERSLQIYRYQSNSLAGRIARAVLWLRNQQPPEAGPDDSRGARFATSREVAALHVPDDAAAMAFGHIGMPLFIKTDKHVLIMASTRSGKGVTLIIPHLLRYRGSASIRSRVSRPRTWKPKARRWRRRCSSSAKGTAIIGARRASNCSRR